MKYALMLYAILLSALLASAARNGNAKVSDLAEHALQQSQLTFPGSRRFHLQATLVETTNPKSLYQAKIEEFWLSPTKWRRFHPYVLNGKTQYFHATVTFPVK